MKKLFLLLFILFTGINLFAQTISPTLPDSIKQIKQDSLYQKIHTDTTSTVLENAIKPYPIWGIDISYYQRKVNWDTVVFYNKPYFIYHKTSEGVTITDTLYNKRKQIAKEKNILFGAYHFFSYRSKGYDQALHFIKIADIQIGDLTPVLDFELRRKMPAKATVIKELRSFLNTFYKHTNIKPIIYCNAYMYNTYIKGNFTDYKFWICDIHKKPTLDWIFWQYTFKAKIKGFGTLIDKDLFYGTEEQLRELILKEVKGN